MKINYKIIFALLAILCAFSTCKKENIGLSIPKIKKQVSGSNSIEFFYDSQGRRSKMLGSPGGQTSTYVYASGAVTFYDTIPGVSTQSTTCTLNSRGLTVNDGTGFYYTYDADGHVISKKYDPDSIISTWVDGNLVSATHSLGNTTTYTYLSSSANTIGAENTGIYFRGKSSKNLVDTETFTSTFDTFIFQYTYVYDSQGRVTEATRSEVGTTWASSTTYTYY